MLPHLVLLSHGGGGKQPPDGWKDGGCPAPEIEASGYLFSPLHFTFLPERDEEKRVWLSLFPFIKGKRGVATFVPLHQGGQSRS